MSKIIDIEIIDLRVPTSDTLQGSDPFHKKPNYSCVLTRINTDDGLLGLSVNFSAGAGNDWLAYGVRDLSRLILGRELEEFIRDPISFYRLLNRPSSASLVGGWSGQDGHWINPQCSLGPLGQDRK